MKHENIRLAKAAHTHLRKAYFALCDFETNDPAWGSYASRLERAQDAASTAVKRAEHLCKAAAPSAAEGGEDA